ncbi:histidine kinase N-terminal 7TM domain-containing protein [Bacillus suaedae]|uniref:Diguanylate cyclase n=1 Tax=Halalkalibacter suaedae TaxID=2822140 RepID=A0A940WUJ9_9BACI|nr:histidine kinase N-terminal 7TM domain-containing protein [Bacillus suaedae]MBP3950737.1 diguanylate cyclase [Bacillus suaedae]
MHHDLTIYIYVLILAGLLSLFLSIYAYFKMKEAPGVFYFILATFLSSIFTFSYALELTSTTLKEITFWLGIQYLALPFIPLCIMLMCYGYIGKKLPRWLGYILFFIPVMTIFMHHTNQFHHLYYTSMELRDDSPFPIIKLVGGPFFYVHSVFVFLCLAISLAILLVQLKQALFRFRIQLLLMMFGIFVPIVAGNFYINGLSPYGIDIGPVSLSVTWLFHGAALFSFQMFNVAPIAREKVFERMKEGVIVLNQNNILVDYNLAAKDLIPTLNPNTITKSIATVFEQYERLIEILIQKNDCDYCHKDNEKDTYYHIRFSELLSNNTRVIGYIVTFVNITERVHLQTKLEELASVDGLTQIFNRTYFLKESERAFERVREKVDAGSIILFDIDYFKLVNDTYGHEAGDIVLTQIVLIAKKTLRETDIFGRYGGEEFIIALPNTPALQAFEMANQIRLNISNNLFQIRNNQLNVTSSFGISSSIISKDNYSIELLIRQADQALYDAKSAGRNCVNLYEGSLQEIS